MAEVNGMLLAAGTSELPASVAYAYVVDPDYSGGKPLVVKGFKHRSVDLAAKGGNPPKRATPNAPKFVDKEWVGAPLPVGWQVNGEALRYEERSLEGATVITSSLPRPMPSAVASSKMASAQRLRR